MMPQDFFDPNKKSKQQKEIEANMLKTINRTKDIASSFEATLILHMYPPACHHLLKKGDKAWEIMKQNGLQPAHEYFKADISEYYQYKDDFVINSLKKYDFLHMEKEDFVELGKQLYVQYYHCNFLGQRMERFAYNVFTKKILHTAQEYKTGYVNIIKELTSSKQEFMNGYEQVLLNKNLESEFLLLDQEKKQERELYSIIYDSDIMHNIERVATKLYDENDHSVLDYQSIDFGK